MPPLTGPELKRYSRHLVLPEIGPAGQERLKASSVLLIGVGGLGSPVGLYLAAAGVGRLGLVDFDTVDESNLQRQVLFGQSDVGRSKLAAASERLAGINPLIDLVLHEEKLTSDNALRIISGYDVVVDGSDNFPTRYLVNDACVLTDKPCVHGSIYRFEGQVGVFWASRGPCYRCLFPEPPPAGLAPSCADGGVLGVLPGIIGSLQASEAIKLVLDLGRPMVGRLLVFDALESEFRHLELAKDEHCPVCGAEPRQTELIDYEQFCAMDEEKNPMEDPTEASPKAPDEMPPFEISVDEVKQWLDDGRSCLVVDVRTPQEYDMAQIEGSTLIPLNELPDRLDELDPDADIIVHCHHGPRSSSAVSYLRSNGFSRARNMSGGINAWSLRIDPRVRQY